MNFEQHHKHLRERIHRRRLKKDVHRYPSRQTHIRLLDNLVVIIGIVLPLTTLPQVFEIWIHKQTQGASLITWSLYFVLTLPLIAYGIVHKEKRLLVMWSLWLIMYGLVVVGLVLF